MKSALALLGAGSFGFAYFVWLINAYDDGLTWDDVKHAALYAVLCAGAVVCLAVIVWTIVGTIVSMAGGGVAE